MKQYDAVGIREDLTDAVFRVAREETPFTSQVASRAKATQKLHEWQTVDLAAPNKNNSIAEDANFSNASNTVTARLQNVTQLSDKVAKVTKSLNAAKEAGRANEMAFQLKHKSLELARDIEAAVISNNQAVAGSTGAPTRTTQGLESWISTNAFHGAGGSTTATTTVGSGGVVTDGAARDLTKGVIDTALQQTYQGGGRPRTMMAGTAMKVILDSVLTNTNTRFVDADQREVISSVDVYYGPFGTIKIMPNYVQDAIGRGGTLYGLDDDKWAVAWLQPIDTTEVPPTGYWEAKAIMGEYALEARNEKSSFKVADLNTTLPQ